MKMSSGDGKERKKIKMSDGALNFREGGFYSGKSCVSIGGEALIELICGILWVSGERMLFLREDKSVMTWCL